MSELIFRVTFRDGNVSDVPLSELHTIRAEGGATYTLIDEGTQEPPEGLGLERKDDDLEVAVDQEAVVHIDDFYGEEDVTFSMDGSLAPAEGMAIRSADPGAAGASADSEPVGAEASDVGSGSWDWQDALAIGGGGAAVGVAQGVGGGSGAFGYSVALAAVSGSFLGTARVEVFDSDGNLLASAEHDFSTGPYVLTVSSGYQGPLLARVIDVNGPTGDYLDEATNTLVSLGEPCARWRSPMGPRISRLALPH